MQKHYNVNMMYHSGKGSLHSHGTRMDVVPTTAGITVNSKPITVVLPWIAIPFPR